MEIDVAVPVIAQRVRARLRADAVDVAVERDAAGRYVRDELRRYGEHALGGDAPIIRDEAETERAVLAELVGLGALQPLLDDPEVEEVWINAPDRIFAARDGISAAVPLSLTDAEVRELVERLLRPTGRRVDLSEPFVDASLPDGSRLHVAIPDVARHWSVNLRRFRSGMRDLQQLVRLGMLTAEAAAFLHLSVRAGLSIIVSGGTGAGKTTLMGALLGAVPADQRIVTVEETFELSLAAPDWVALQGRRPGLEGTGEIPLRRLVKEALRMRPDRLVVGEVRQGESLDLLLALNSGHAGMSSVHANGAPQALAKLCLLPLLAGSGVDMDFIVPTVATTVELVVHVARGMDGARRVTEIAAPSGRVIDRQIELVELFAAGHDGTSLRASGQLPPRLEVFERSGLDPRPLLRAT